MGAGTEMFLWLANAGSFALLLAAERRRLPMQNVVALGGLSLALGTGLEWGMAWARGAGPMTWVHRAGCWPVAWLGARLMARQVTTMGGPLAVRTLAFGILLLPGMGEVASQMVERGWLGVGLAAARMGWLLLGFLALAPWWIRKPLSAPRAALPFAGATAVLAMVLQASLGPGEPAGLGWARVVALAGPLGAAAWMGHGRNAR